MHAYGSGQSQSVLSLFYNLYYTFYLVVLGCEQLRPTVSWKGMRCTDQFLQWLYEVPEIQHLDWWRSTGPQHPQLVSHTGVNSMVQIRNELVT
jgi:hypothetical protein